MVIVCIFVNIGMWFERFVITVTSLCRDFLPSSWAYFRPTEIDIMMLIGSFGLFTSPCSVCSVAILPVIAISEVKNVIPETDQPLILKPIETVMTNNQTKIQNDKSSSVCSLNSRIRRRWSMPVIRRVRPDTKRWMRIRRSRCTELILRLGIKRTILPFIVLAIGLGACAIGLGMQYYTNNDVSFFGLFPGLRIQDQW